MTTLLIAGGYGTVGAQIARMLVLRHPKLAVVLGGRNPGSAAALVASHPRLSSRFLDLAAVDPLAGFSVLPDAVLVAANDHDDHMLRSCINRRIAWIDITRWTARVRDALGWMGAHPAHAPMVLASSWMASVPATLAVAAARDFARVDRIAMDVLYALQDRAGPNSVDYLDRLATPFALWRNQGWVQQAPLVGARQVQFDGAPACSTAPFDSPDQLTLPAITGAGSVSTFIGFDDALANHLLRTLVRSGIWRAIGGPAFAGLRRRLLFNPGAGDHHRVRVTVVGESLQGVMQERVVDIDDPSGQTHLTAVGALVQVERVLGLLEGHAPASAGAQYAEAVTDARLLQLVLSEQGVQVRHGVGETEGAATVVAA